MRTRHLPILLGLSIASICLANAQEEKIILGVLEDTPGHYSGDPNYRSVRVVFYKDDAAWKAFRA
jgi:hypothetical protein